MADSDQLFAPPALDASIDALTVLVENAANLPGITYTSSAGSPVSDLVSSAFVQFASHIETVVPKLTRTRVLRSTNSAVLAASSTSTPTRPEAGQEDDFLPLDALIFLLQTANEPIGQYVSRATRERVARVDTLERPGLLDFLLGKKPESECSLVLSLEECQARETKQAQQEGAQTTAEAQEAAGQEAVEASTSAADEPASTATTADATASSSKATTTAQASSSLHPLIASSKRPYAPSKQDAAFVKRLRTNEVVLRDRTWAFRCVKSVGGIKSSTDGGANGEIVDFDEEDNALLMNGGVEANGPGRTGGAKEVDFTPLRRSVIGRIADARKGASATGSSGSKGAPPSAPVSVASSTSSLGRSAKHKRLDPIIILPSSPSSLLTLANIKAFLEEGVFIAPSSVSGLAPMGGSNEIVAINRPKGGRFLAVDSLEALSRLGGGSGSNREQNDPWKRVVCVITTGQKWQFKGYRWDQGRDLFRNVFGLYPRFNNQPADGNVKEWNVSEIVIDSGKRNHDRQISVGVWRSLEAWIARKKPELA